MEPKKKYLIGIGLILISSLLFSGFSLVRHITRQPIPLRAMTDGTGATETDTRTLYPKQELQPGTTYQVTVTYHMEPQKGSKLFCHRNHKLDNTTPVNYRCSPLKMTTTFTAQKKHISLLLTASLQPEDITDSDGHVLDLTKHTLCPVVTLTPLKTNQ